MILGKIIVFIEQQRGRQRWIYCRPRKYANGDDFPNIIGVAHVIFLEKCVLTENLQTNQEYTFYGIFNRLPSEEQMDSGFILSQVQPITEETYNQLLDIYPQTQHRFLA